MVSPLPNLAKILSANPKSNRSAKHVSLPPAMAMTFVDNDGKPFESPEGQGENDLGFTVHINQALGRMGSITCENRCSSFQERCFFKLIGGNRCTPCFGLVREPLSCECRSMISFSLRFSCTIRHDKSWGNTYRTAKAKRLRELQPVSHYWGIFKEIKRAT